MLHDLNLDLSVDAEALLARLVSAEPYGLIAEELQINDGGLIDAAIELAGLWLIAADAPIDADAENRGLRRRMIPEADLWSDVVVNDADRLRNWLLEGDMRIRMNEIGLLLGWAEDVESLPRPFGLRGAATPASQAFKELIQGILKAEYWLHARYSSLAGLVAPKDQPDRHRRLHALQQGWSRSIDIAIAWLTWFASQRDLQSSRTWCGDAVQTLTAYKDFNIIRPKDTDYDLLASVERIATESGAMLAPIDRQPPIKWTKETIEPEVAKYLRRRPGASKQLIAEFIGCSPTTVFNTQAWKNRPKAHSSSKRKSSKERSLDQMGASTLAATTPEPWQSLAQEQAEEMRSEERRRPRSPKS